MLPAARIYYFRRAIYNAIYNAETGCGSCISAADFHITLLLLFFSLLLFFFIAYILFLTFILFIIFILFTTFILFTAFIHLPPLFIYRLYSFFA